MSKRKNENQSSPDKAVKSRKSEETSLEESNIDEREFVVEVKTLLRNKATLLSGLNKLRDVLKSKEPRSFAVFKEFIRENSECPEVYKVLEKGRQQQTPLELQIALEILENLFLFTAEDLSSFGQVGMYHVRRILHNHLKLIYSCLNPTCHFNMIKGALRLLVAMVTQGVSAAREVVAVFDFTLKALGSLVNKRDLKTSEDIRTCFTHFVMSFVMYGDDATIRHVLDIKGFASSIFKLFPSDSPDVVNLVLTVLHQKVVQNNTIPKKTKVQFFSSFVLTKLASLYDYNKEENTEEDEKEQDERQTIKERIHKMLQDICCTFKFGICFANKMGMFSGRSNNPVLLRFLQSLPKHDQNLHLRQLIIQVLTCCPDLVQPYLSSQSTTYEPRLSLPWLTNMNFITKLYSALPSPSDMIDKSSIRLTEESVQLVLNTVLPSVLTRANLNQGIQHSSLLVKNTTLSLLVLIMNRAYNLLHYCEKEKKSTIAPQSSQGLSFVEMFREALLRALPDVKTIISLRQNLVASEMLKDKKQEEGEDVDMKDELMTSKNAASPSLLLARVLQTLHFYQKIQPTIFATTAFDLGKLLPGQQEMIDRIFTPIVQHYTLEILSDLPRGMFKWYQQRSKNGPSYMYSVLKMFVQASSKMIRNKAKILIIKFLQDTGIITQDLTEVDTWLKHLNMSSFERHRETLLMFLDSVCHTVAMEPYTYTDVVMEMISEAKARQANGEKFSFMLNVEDNLLGGNYESRVAFSPLIVKALMAHTQMVSAIQDKYTNDQMCSIAQYINVVILDVLRNTINPLPLILTVKRFYGNEVISVDSASLKTTHHSLLSYVDTWIGDCKSMEAGKNQEEQEMKFGLDAFLKAQASNPSQETLASFLSDLNEAQLEHAVGPCVQLCMLKHSGELRSLVDLLMVKPYCITGSKNEDIFPLLKKIPFANLLWQVFGPLLKTLHVNGHIDAENQDTRNISRDDKVFLLVQHPGIQSYLVDSLLKEDLSTFPPLCNNLLQYLSAFVSQASKFSNKKQDYGSCQGNTSRCQGDEIGSEGTSNVLMSVVSLLFLLIDAMIERFETFESANKSDKSLNRNSKQPFIMETESILGEIQSSKYQNVDEFKATESEENCQQIQEDFLKTLLQNPVLLNCFLNKFDSEESTSSAAVWSGLTFCIGDLLQGIVDEIQSGTQRKLLKPYTRKMCEKVVGLVAKATVNGDISPDGPALQALQLLQVFSPFCDQSTLSEPIANLLELPFEALVKKSPNQVEPTIYLQTLFALLDPQANHVTQSSNQGSDQNDVMKRAVQVAHPCQVTSGSSQDLVIDDVIKGSDLLNSLANQGSSLVDIDSMFSHMIDVSNQKAALFSTLDFVKVTKLLQEVPSKQLEQIVLKLLRKTPRYILEVDPSLLDHCLDYVTEDRVSIATILIASSASLRVHFEQRCTSRGEDSGVRQLSLRDHHWDLLPVVHWYLSYAESTGALSSENNVVSYLSDTYWPYLWNWIREPKKNTNTTQDLSCAVLKFLVTIRSHDIKDTRKLFSKLLDLIPSQSWDVYQMTIIRMMLDLLVKNCSDENKQSVLVVSAVSVCMVNISLMLQLDSVDDKSLITHAVSMLLDIISTHTGCLLQGEDSLVEVETWSTFVKNCLKYMFDCAMTLQCMTACLKPLYNSTKHKTLTREFPLTTMYQLILSHSKFLEILLENDEESSVKLKESLLDLVVAIAEMCPECCESSHLPVFFGSYTATLSKTDQSILYLLHLYERAQVPLSSFRPYLWGKAALEHHKIKKIQGPSLWQQPSTNEVLELLDVTTLNRSALDFPKERKLRPRVQSDVAAKDNHSSMYDPCFILPLFCHLLSQNSVVDCRKFVERGGLGYAVSALSSRDEHMRKAASHVLSRCLLHMDAASFREKKQVYLLLESLQNGITDVNVRVSSVITRFVSRAAYVMLHPESQMYVLVNSFLLQRAVMDLREVPLFYTLFNSSSLQHRNERMWMLHLLVEGLRDAKDYYVYKKRHVMELVMSYHDSQMSDQQSRKLVITLVKATLSIHSAAFDLSKNYAIVGWIHSLCLTSPNDADRLSTSLRLLHTLWFTIQQGKPGTCDEVDSGDAPNSTPYPPNLCGESLLVCKTLIKLYSSSSSLNDLPMLLELLGSVLGHLRQTQTATEGSHLTHKEVLQLISSWCILYNESQVLSALKQEVQLTGQETGTLISSEDEKPISKKQKSLELLLDIISLWRPTLTLEEEPGSEITNDGVSMLACSFVLHFASSIRQTVDHSDQSLLKVVTWFRYCIASSASLQKSLLSHLGEPCLMRLLFLFGCTSGVSINLVRELGMIFLVLLSRVQHMENALLGRTASEVAKLLSSDVYQEVMKSVVEEILLPLCPSPLMDETAENVDVEVTHLVSAFLKDLWFIYPVPTHFLTLASINNNTVSSNLSSVFKGSTKLKGIIRSLKKKGANS